jgi:hypothetical protein
MTRNISAAIQTPGVSDVIPASNAPLPWRVLNYDTRQGGHVVDLDEGAPSYESGREPRYDRAYDEEVI